METKFNEAKQKFAQQVEKTPILSAIYSLVIGKELNEEEMKNIRDFKSVQDYLDLPLNDPAEDKFKKLFAVAVVGANQKGVLKLPEGYENPESIASIVDEGLTRIKVAYQVAEGKVNPIIGEEVINDRGVVRTAAVVNVVIDRYTQKANEYVNTLEKTALSVSDKLVELGFGRLGDLVCKGITRIFPPAHVLVPYVKPILRFVKPVVQKAIQKGIKVVATAARNTITKVATVAKKVVSKITDWLLG